MSVPWGVHSIGQIFGGPNLRCGLPDGRWVTCIAEPYDSPRSRVQAAWWVLTGRAHAVIWPKAGELEDALGIPASACKRPPFPPPAPIQEALPI